MNKINKNKWKLIQQLKWSYLQSSCEQWTRVCMQWMHIAAIKTRPKKIKKSKDEDSKRKRWKQNTDLKI